MWFSLGFKEELKMHKIHRILLGPSGSILIHVIVWKNMQKKDLVHEPNF